jgi:S-layer protein (TIGR01567 family)
MITKRGVKGVISVLIILGAVYASAGYLFETNLNDTTAIVAVPVTILASAATPGATVAPSTASSTATPEATTTSATIAATIDPTTTAAMATPDVTANATATANSTAIATPTITNATATATSTATVNATVNETANATATTNTTNATVTATPTTNATANATVNETANATATTTPTSTAAPSITGFSPNSPVSDTEGTPRIFEVATNQNVNVTWYINGKEVQSNESVTTAAYTNTSAASGTWAVNATATNDNGTASQEWLWEVRDAVPPGNVTNLTEAGNGPTYINWTWENPPDPDFGGTSILIDGNFKTNLSKTSNDYSATDLAPATSHNITVIAFDTSDNLAPQPWPENMGITLPPPPQINVIQEPASLNITVRDSVSFDISVDQEANISWTVDGNTSIPALILAGGSSNFTFTPTTKGDYSITAEASNTNGTSSKSWNVTVHPIFFSRGNRIWDGSKPDEFSLTYNWNPMSFSGFYYDINDDVGNENIAITLDSYSSRTISSGKLVYTTSPQEVSFGYSGFGSYDVIGFMADKYFAGYTANSSPPDPTTAVKASSALAQGQLHKVLIDDDTQRTISLGGTLTLQEGYVLKAKDIDTNARTMLISLLKDGSEVDSTPLSAGQTYVYSKKEGAVSDLPIIMVRFDSVFSGTEVQAAFLKGVFQISESYDKVSSGNDFGVMEVSSVSGDKIEMSNNADISLGAGSTQDLMGNMKIIVADNSSVVRFALSVEETGNFEVRSSVYREDDPIDEWTPYNFGLNIGKTSIGFYYDLDDGIGNESLRLSEPLDGSRTINDGNLLYTTTPQEVSFGYSGFGSYDVIGFMADKYFAGYTANSSPPDPTTAVKASSVLAQGQLHKVLIDDDTQRTISLGGTLTLQEGYVLKATDIDTNARTMLISLLKDGSEVDSTPLSAGQTYVYSKKVGAVSDLPIIMIRFDSVFSGTEVQAAFLKGVFQISENYSAVNSGNNFGKMKVTSVSDSGLDMSNDGSISLDNGNTEELMGNVQLKVGDTTDNSLRFYFAVNVTPEMVANQLIIDAPAQATAGDNILINVTAGGDLIGGASLAIDSSDIGQTDNNGTLNYTLPRTMTGVHNITATKLGYQGANKSIEVLEYIERRLSIDAPTTADQFKTITINITYNGTAVSNATVKYDNTTIGLTDNNGALNYTLETSGTHTIEASGSGYITVAREIEVRAPYSEYRALDINITPNVVFTDENAVIKSNITNVGTKKDTLPVELIINGTAVDNRSVALAPGEIKEINFTRKQAKAGNYTVEILGQKGLLEVKERPFTWSLILIIAIVTGLGLIAIYLLTVKNKINFESVREKLRFGNFYGR